MRRSEFMRAAMALAAALALTLIIGSHLGWSTNPAVARANQMRITEYYAAHPINTPAENEAFLASLETGPQPDPPPPVIAVLQWHQVLLAWLMLAALLVCRPGRIEAAIVTAPAAVLLFLAAGAVPGMGLIAALVVYVLIASAIPRLLRPSRRAP